MTQKLKIKKSDCNMIESLKSNDFVAKNKTVLKSQKQNQELAMLDLEVASLKLELLTQTEIAKNNKDAYDEVRRRYNNVSGRLEDAQDVIKTLEKQIEPLNAQLKIEQVKTQTESYLKDKEKARVAELMNGTQLLRQKNLELFNRLKCIPKWVRWIFKYIF